MIKLSSRLQTIANMIKPCDHLIDVGCDHGYLSIYLTLNKIVKHVLNIDVNKEPLESAYKNSISYHVDEFIDCRLNNGLKDLKLSFIPNYVTISGMGGVLISIIIENSSIQPDKYIVQPNNNVTKLRKWLFENNYEITNENVVFDNDIGYVVIELQKAKNKVNYDNNDLFVGPILKTKKDNEEVRKFFNEKLNKLLKIPVQFLGEEKTQQLNTIKDFLNA